MNFTTPRNQLSTLIKIVSSPEMKNALLIKRGESGSFRNLLRPLKIRNK